MNYIRQSPTEDCPLTKDNHNNCLSIDCCKCGFKAIVGVFALLTAAITAALILQLIYQDNIAQARSGIHGAVATDNAKCSLIGTQILRKKGNAIDAAIAAALCTTVVVPHKTGLGGGGYIMMYNRKYKSSPLIVDFASNTVKGDLKQVNIRIPALLKGFEFTHFRYGILSWHELVEPTISLANNGFIVSRELAQQMSKNDKFYEKRYNAGELLKLPLLANTLSTVAKGGSEVLYNETLIDKLLYSNSSILSDNFKQDLANYVPQINTAINSSSLFYGHSVFYPSHATLLSSIVEEIAQLHITTENASTIDSQKHVIKTLVRLNREMQKINEEGRYSGVVAIDGQDMIVCVLSGMNTPLNMELMTNAGFVLDSVTHTDYLISLVPVVFYDENSLCGLLGTFGTDDQTLVGQLLYNLIVRSLNISEAIELPRYYVYHDEATIESDDIHTVDTTLRRYLKSVISLRPADEASIMKSVNVVIKRRNLISSHSDSRGEGLAYRF